MVNTYQYSDFVQYLDYDTVFAKEATKTWVSSGPSLLVGRYKYTTNHCLLYTILLSVANFKVGNEVEEPTQNQYTSHICQLRFWRQWVESSKNFLPYYSVHANINSVLLMHSHKSDDKAKVVVLLRQSWQRSDPCSSTMTDFWDLTM